MRAFKLARAAEVLGGEEEVESPCIFPMAPLVAIAIMQVFENKEAAIEALCAFVGKGYYVFEVGPIQEGMEVPDSMQQKFTVFSMNGLVVLSD
jgi:hypothetical protein